MNDRLKAYFVELAQRRTEDEKQLKAQRAQNQISLEDFGGGVISSLELVNTLPNGKIQTVNSMKYHSKTIKAKLGIDFKFHHLRHTYGTIMAELNTPTHLLQKQMGHSYIHTTQRYYIAMSSDGVDILQGKLNQL
jgi:integrase